jgi:hypothetical protein
VTSLKEYITRHDLARRKSRTARRHVREDAGDVSVMRSADLNMTSVALPGDVDLKIRAARMNEFWQKLVDYQHRDVLVVAGEDVW